MCGIGVLIAPTPVQEGERTAAEDKAAQIYGSWPSLLQNVQRRGPDCWNTDQREFFPSNSTDPWTLSLASSVLSLRGQGLTVQPLSSHDGRLHLAWNGEIFDWDASAVSSAHATSSKVRLDTGENDVQILLDRIQSLLDDGLPCQQALNLALAEVEGPYAFVLYDKLESKVYFGRDPLGRRSLLLFRAPPSPLLALLSVASEGLLQFGRNEGSESSVTEVSCLSLWYIALLDDPTSPIPITRAASRFTSPLLLRELHPLDQDVDVADGANSRADFLAVLSESVRRHVTNINTNQPASEAHVAVLFSGGLDCTTLALLADRYIPPDQPIDLLNVGFENVRAIEAAKNEREKRLRAKSKLANKKHSKGRPRDKISGTSEGLESSVGQRIQPRRSMEAANEDEEAENSDDIYAVPDRITGLASYAELCRLAPTRRWNFVEINVSYAEYTLHRPYVETLMFPTSSVMDLSIGAALYFASRAQGHLRPCGGTTGHVTAYTSPARVLISGLGADELLGGYSRHRQAYTRSSLAGLISELQLDLDRLPSRNLGRDDRVLSTHAKEARYPYLDRSVLHYLTSIRVESKVDLQTIATQGAGGDKRLLRDIAKLLGLQRASDLKKRAMQFGTRSAKIDNESKNAKGHHKLS